MWQAGSVVDHNAEKDLGRRNLIETRLVARRALFRRMKRRMSSTIMIFFPLQFDWFYTPYSQMMGFAQGGLGGAGWYGGT